MKLLVFGKERYKTFRSSGLDAATVTASIDGVWGSALTAVSASESHAAGDKTRSTPIDLAQKKLTSWFLAASRAESHFKGRTPTLKVRISAGFLGAQWADDLCPVFPASFLPCPTYSRLRQGYSPFLLC